MRSILLHVAGDDCLEARTQVALDLARAFDAHLTCLQAMPFEYGMPGDIYGAMVASLLPQIRESEAALRRQHEARLANEDVSWSWLQEDGPALPHLLRHSALSDLVIVGSREPLQKGASVLASALAVRAQTAVMIVPEHLRGLDCAGPAVVAWNGSAEAGHALKAALPLLRRASQVVLAMVGPQGKDPLELPVSEAAQYLSRYDIHAEVIEFPHGNGSVAHILADAALARGAAYLVLGAFGLPRMVETMFGGVTRELLATPPLPLLTCH